MRLDEVVLRALEHKPELRYQQASVLKTAVDTLAETIAGHAAVPPAPDPTEKAKSQIVRIVEILFGIPLTSPLAVKLVNISALGFLGSLGFLGYVPLPPMHRCFIFFGFTGFFGLIGIAFMVEIAQRRKAAAVKSAQSNPLPTIDFWEALDAGNYAGAWAMTAPYFQRDTSKDEWMSRMEKMRRPLGKALSRELLSTNWLTVGIRIETRHSSSFLSGITAVETQVVALQPDHEWRIESYRIDPIDKPSVGRIDQQTIDETEWNNPANWTGPKWLSVYFSKKDARAWLPKQVPALGWTINLGHPRGALALMAIVAIILVLQLVVTVGVMNLASNEGIGAVDNPVFVPVVIGMIVIDGLIVLGLWRAVSKRPVADHRKHPPHSTQ